MGIQIAAWSNVSDSPPSMEAIQNVHSRKEHYRFTRDGYAGGAHFIGTLSAPTTIYVLEGTLIYTINDVEIRLNSGEFAEFGSCNYVCDVPIDSGVKFIRVTQLPERLRK